MTLKGLKIYKKNVFFMEGVSMIRLLIVYYIIYLFQSVQLNNEIFIDKKIKLSIVNFMLPGR